MANISHFTQTVNGVSTTYDIHDADAVDLTNNQTVGGVKTFSDGVVGNVSGTVNLTLRTKSSTARIFLRDNSAASFPNTVNLYSTVNGQEYGVFLNGNTFHPISNDMNLGVSSHKWKTFNGINPGALSLPSNNAVNILSELQSDGYTAPSNGYVRGIKNVQTNCSSTFGIRNETTGIEDRRITERTFILGVIVPVQAGEKVIISDDWNSVSNATITYSAYFYPCQGNV